MPGKSHIYFEKRLVDGPYKGILCQNVHRKVKCISSETLVESTPISIIHATEKTQYSEMSLFITGERCPNIMTSGAISTVDLIDSPTDLGDKQDVIPGGEPLSADVDELEIVINLQTGDYSSGDVTKISVTPENVKTIEIIIQDENGDWVPYNPETPGSSQPQELSPNDMPVVLRPRFQDATKVKIILTRDDGSQPMTAEVDVLACLEPG